MKGGRPPSQAPKKTTTTTSNDSAVVMDRRPTSITTPPTQAPLQLAVNTLAFEREPVHWWLRTPQGATQAAFLRVMGWRS
jgi:hypothetical protein